MCPDRQAAQGGLQCGGRRPQCFSQAKVALMVVVGVVVGAPPCAERRPCANEVDLHNGVDQALSGSQEIALRLRQGVEMQTLLLWQDYIALQWPLGV